MLGLLQHLRAMDKGVDMYGKFWQAGQLSGFVLVAV
jgi:hypothetical protein